MIWKVYILRSLKKKWYYVGSTNRIRKRFIEHNKGLVKSTKPYRPFSVIFIKNFNTEQGARAYEKKLKKCRIEKEKIIKQFESEIL